MNMKTGERVFAGLILVFVIFFLLSATRMNSVAGRMPLIVGTFTLILVVAYFVNEYWPRKAEPTKFAADLDEDDELLAPEKDELNWYDIRVWGWLLVLMFLVFFFGITLGIGLLTTIFYRFAAKQSWRGAVIFGVLQGVFLFAVFDVLFRAALYPGWIIEKLLGG
jgi:hypothetical protein